MITTKTLIAAAFSVLFLPFSSAHAADHIVKTKLNATQMEVNVIVDADKYVSIDAKGSAQGNGHGPVTMKLIIDHNGKNIHRHATAGQDGLIAIEGNEMVYLTKGKHKFFVEFGNGNANPVDMNVDVTPLN